MFSKDVEKRLPLLQTMPSADTLTAFITQVHALKSASASIGAAEVSVMAEELEAAGKAEDLAFIEKQLPAFAGQITKLVKNVGSVLKEDTGVEGNETPSTESLIPLLRELEATLHSSKADDIDRILEELGEKSQDAKMRKALEKISDDVLMAEYDRAVETVRILAGEGTQA